jgi:hypothetical protein
MSIRSQEKLLLPLWDQSLANLQYRELGRRIIEIEIRAYLIAVDKYTPAYIYFE